MNNIKYVVVCKKGYCFACNITDIIKFIEEQGRNIAYYVGYFHPVENLSFLDNLDTNLSSLGDVLNE